MNNGSAQPDARECGVSIESIMRHALMPEQMTAVEREAMLNHLRVCTKCAEDYGEIAQAGMDYLAEIRGELPFYSQCERTGAQVADIWQRIDAWEAEQAEEGRRIHICRIGRIAIAAAACLLLAVALFCYPDSRMQQPSEALSMVAKRESPSANPPIGRRLVYSGSVNAEVPSPPLASAIPDLEHLDYAQWRDQSQPWFADRFPWIFQAQKVLQAKGVEADYIELLIVSGDIWQFGFDSKQLPRVPLVSCQQASLDRLAKHYGLASLKLDKASSVSAQDPSLAIAQWYKAICEAEKDVKGPPTDLMLFALRACDYLCRTRTAVYLWGRDNPHAFVLLLQQSPTGQMLVGQAKNDSASRLLDKSEAQARSGWEGLSIIQEVLLTPVSSGSGCHLPSGEKKLSRCLVALVPQLTAPDKHVWLKQLLQRQYSAVSAGLGIGKVPREAVSGAGPCDHVCAYAEGNHG